MELEGAVFLWCAHPGDHAQVVGFTLWTDQSSLEAMSLMNGNHNLLSHTIKRLGRNELKEDKVIVLTIVLVEMIGALKLSSEIKDSLKRQKSKLQLPSYH